MNRCRMQDADVPPELLGELTDSAPLLARPADLRGRLAAEGYLFLRDVLDRGEVLQARERVLSRLVDVGEIAPPAAAGIATGSSRRRELYPDLGAFWKSVSEERLLRQVTHGARLRGIMEAVLGEAVSPHDFLFLRIGAVGRSTRLHYDRPFFAAGSERTLTVWIAFGDIPVSDGPLVVLEHSNRFDDLISQSRGIDYKSVSSPRVAANESPVDIARRCHTRLLTADFRAGDLALFDMSTMHGSLDNCSPAGRVRVSCDVRYQPAADRRDERYYGESPAGTTGIGYAELNGAKPLTEDWHVR